MAMMGVVSGSLYRQTHSLSRLAWSWVGGRFAPFYTVYSSNEPGELSQWLCHDDSTINIVMVITIIIIFIIIINAMHQRCIQTVSFVLFKKNRCILHDSKDQNTSKRRPTLLGCMSNIEIM